MDSAGAGSADGPNGPNGTAEGAANGAPALVVIGSSAGGVEALSTLVATLPAEFGAPIVVAQHLDPRRESHLNEILARRTELAVTTVQERERLRAGTIFVVPADRNVEIADGAVIVQPDSERRERAGSGGTGSAGGAGGAGEAVQPKPSVDRLLRSAAESHGEGLIAVILTGSGSDGAAGARAVKEAGGTVIIQNPQTASFPSMPRSLAPATVDIVADLETIGPLLHELVAGPRAPAEPNEDRSLRTLLEQLRQRSGIDFTGYKTPTILRRLQRRMVAVGMPTIAEYARYVQRNPDEYERLVSSFLIKVTGFFRDAELFAYLRERLIPELVEAARMRGKELRCWSAGCATGEEAYSLAILVAEALGDELERFTVRVFATDLDSEAIVFARQGVYPAAALANVPRELVERHFTRLPSGEYEIVKRIRALTVFGQHDLGQRAPFPRIDLALCRNVLIYFTTELQRRALQLFAFALREGGYLLLGKAETVSPLAEYFGVADSSLKLYRRMGSGPVNIPAARIRDVAPVLPARPGPAHGVHGVQAVQGGAARMAPTLLDAAGVRAARGAALARTAGERLEGLLMQLPVGVVVVDRRYDVQVINGAARRLLGIHSSAVGEDFVHLAQAVPSAPLRELIDRVFRGEAGQAGEADQAGEARRTGGDASGGGLGSADEGVQVLKAEPPVGEVRYLQVAAHPYRQEEHGEALTVVLAWDVTQLEEQRLRLANERAQREGEMERLSQQLERLRGANRQLLAANQELAETNAGLRSANEELLLSHEEAQAATEEVETLNEELQATNEEQETLNEELQATVEELNTTNDDLQARSSELQELAAALEDEREQLRAVLASMGEPVLVLDDAGAPLLTNEAYERLFGRADGAAESLAAAREAAGGAGEMGRTGPFEVRFGHTGPDGRRRTYEARGRPVVGERGRQGSVITFWMAGEGE